VFSEGFHYPKGPLKALSEEDKERVHILAEIRLDELEETE
jgi:demethoxyubiquinone hydroxylase (CLK1/Coq7/Cat5 family)